MIVTALLVQQFFHDLIDFDRLAKIDDAPVRMESTWDRSGGNNDGFNPAFVRNGVYRIADLKGPGVIRRLYSAKPGGRLRIFLDGAPSPAIDIDCERFFSGKESPFLAPVAGQMGGGFYSFFPIPYAKSARVELAARDGANYGQYYQVTYQTYPEGVEVESLKLPLDTQAAAAWRRVLERWSRPERQHSGELHSAAAVKPGDRWIAAIIEGPGEIRGFTLDIRPRDPALLRSLLLRIAWDGQESPAVLTPLGDFFGNAFDWTPFRTLPMGLDESGFYCNFVMPFARRAEITLINQHPSITASANWTFEQRGIPALTPDTGLFHARWRRQETAGVDLHESNTTGADNYAMLDGTGPGRYIGSTLNVWNRHLIWWGEGDPMIFVDDDRWPPRIHGTGTEEYFNDAWGFHASVSPVSAALLAGLSSPGRCFGPNAVFTFHLADSVPFRQRIRATIEHGTENTLNNEYSSVAYWYARPGAKDFFPSRVELTRSTPAPGAWEKLRSDTIAAWRTELRDQVREIASALDRFPTNAERHPRRVRVLRVVFQMPSELGYDPAVVKRLEDRMHEARRRPLPDRFPVMDAIFRELAGQHDH